MKREALIQKIYDQGGVAFFGDDLSVLPVPTIVSLEDFFEDNPQPHASIAANLEKHPGANTFYYIFQWIRNRPTVQDVVIAIVDVSDDDPDPNWWPYSDHVFILTKASLEEVNDWMNPLNPDMVEDQTKWWQKWCLEKPTFIHKLMPDYKAVFV